jgi:hypothetical protein
MRKQSRMVFAGGVVALLLGGCDRSTSTRENLASDAPATSEAVASDQDAESGFLTYDETGMDIPVTARYPDSVEVSGMGSGEGVGVFFTFKPAGNVLDDAEVHVFLPAGGSSAAEIASFVTGPGGLIENNGWSIEGTRPAAVPEFPYPWAETVFDISAELGQSGHILLGQTAGQAVQVTLLYPTDMAEEYWRVAKPILDSLQFDGSLLPIASSDG